LKCEEEKEGDKPSRTGELARKEEPVIDHQRGRALTMPGLEANEIRHSLQTRGFNVRENIRRHSHAFGAKPTKQPPDFYSHHLLFAPVVCETSIELRSSFLYPRQF
jgi:hypothetical protein